MPVEPLLPPPPAVDDAIRVAAEPCHTAVARMVRTLGCLAWLGICVLASPTPAPAEPLPGPALTVPEPRARSAVVPLPADPGSGPVVLDLPYEGFGADAFDGAVAPGGSPSCGPDCVVPGSGFPDCFDDLWAARPWCWQLMPNNLIYTSYLAGPKEPRIGSSVYDDTEPALVGGGREGWLWDTTLGGRASILRYGSDTVVHPQGFEVQIEGAAFVRLDPQDERDLRSADYRFGVPVVYGVGRWQTKFAYYHNSAHLGDEFMLKHPTYPRINYVRDCLVWGNSWYPLDWLRLYGEVGWAFYNAGGSEPWELQGGCELIQARPTGGRGAPFLAVNGMSRQELDWGGNVCVQAGWAWRGRRSEKLYRVGFEYLYGSDPQYEFVYNNQNRCGFGMWYDF
ncbi:MAG: DUF1207 domain-containing protein [Planctomycetes bacterium]|nr:DUF1207 domain-containing protein [Planctomycetota bacterium]